jgi:NAD+ diphosphatase
MNAFDSFPLGQPGFVSHILDRSAHLRSDETKLLALENHPAPMSSIATRWW